MQTNGPLVGLKERLTLKNTIQIIQSMKKQILGLALVATMFGAVATGCSSTKKTDSSDSSSMTKDTTKMSDTTKTTDTTKTDTTKKDTTKKM